MSDNLPADWAIEKAISVFNSKATLFKCTVGEVKRDSDRPWAATVLELARYMERYDEPPLTPEQQAEIALEQALGFMHKDFEKQFWQGTYTYTATIMEKLEAAGFQIVKKETACD